LREFWRKHRDDDSDNESDVLIDFDFDFHFAPEFWHFFLSSATERKLCAVSHAAGSRSLVRLAFKSFEMGIPFSSEKLDGTSIDPCADQLFASHKEKIEAMQRWEDSPFRIMHIVTHMRGGSFLKRLGKKLNCSDCKKGRGNKNCVRVCCKKCCLANIEIKTCCVYSKKEVAVQEEVTVQEEV
jgi:hypothetical protein